MSLSAQAATLYVSAGGHGDVPSNSYTRTQAQNITTPWRTIAFAVTQMVGGDTVLVRGGTYTGEGTIRIATTTGTQALPIVLKNYPSESPIIDWGHNPAVSFQSVAATESANQLVIGTGAGTTEITWVTIEGFEIRNGWSVNLSGARFATLRGNYIHHNRGGIGTYGKDVWIEKNRIWSNGDVVLCQQTLIFSNCNNGHGIYAVGERWTIVNNIIGDNLCYGVQIQAGTTAGVPDATYTNADSMLVANNTIAYERNCAAVTLSNNGDIPLNNRIENNIFYENGQSANITANGAGVDFVDVGNNPAIIRNNVFYATASPGMTNFTFFSNSSCSGSCVLTNNSLTANPLLVSAPATMPAVSTLDFHLSSSSSPAIDFARNLTACGVTLDIAGSTRPVGAGTCASPSGAAWEAGAYEFGVIDTTPPAPPSGVVLT